jgi:hypothetical protein
VLRLLETKPLVGVIVIERNKLMKTKVKLIRHRIETTEVEVEVPDILSIEGSNDQELYYNLSDAILECAEAKSKDWKSGDCSKASFDNHYIDDLDIDSNICICGHTYHRHFDTYEDMRSIGCKYCGCYCFVGKSDE